MSVKVKICGLTRLKDALTALEYGADYLGFVLHPASRRYLAPEDLRELIRKLPPEAETVGVTVDLSAAENRRLRDFCRFKIVQLHGAEPPAMLDELAGMRVWKALHLETENDLDRLSGFHAAEMILADSAAGGSGVPCDWRLAARAAATCRVALAGGITPDNVLTALAAVRPAAVDCAGGVEVAPGIKDHDKLFTLIKKVKQYE